MVLRRVFFNRIKESVHAEFIEPAISGKCAKWKDIYITRDEWETQGGE